jgi:3-hydroxyisobutyrate dehydrogenase
MAKVGIAGAGKMGTAIGLRLLEQGHAVVVYNRTPERAKVLLDAGATWAATPQQLIQNTDLVLSLLSNEAAMDEVYQGADGLLKGPVSGKLIVEMSTTSPPKQQAMAALVQAQGAGYLECPVSGSVGPAREGKLMGFVGGDAADLLRAQTVLEALCRRIEHVGLHGAGATMKLAINLPLMVYWQTFAEALSLIQPLGLDPQRVVEMFTESSGGPNMLKVRGGMVVQALAGTPSPNVTVHLATMRKDVRAMLAHAQSHHLALPLTEQTLKNFDQAAADGFDDLDCTQIPVWWLKEQVKKQVKPHP